MVSRVFVTALSLVSALAQALVYGLGGYLAVTGAIEPGTVVTLALLLTRLYTPMTALANARVDVMTRAGVVRAGLRGARPAADDHRAARRRASCPPGRSSCGCATCASATRARSRSRWPRWRTSRCSTTAPASEVLHGRRPARSAPGSCSRWSGRPAPGKSTIAALVPRLYDVDAGAVRARPGSTCGTWRSRRSAARSAWSPRTGTCSTTRSAPTCATPPRTPPTPSWCDALRRARLGELLAALPDGLDTVVGERGYRLSGGERQRLTIARLLLARPRVVILDEATAHLDSESEAAVQAALAEALAGRTAIVIAHRLSTVRAADQIAVVEHGRIVERGTHEELLAAGGRYAELYRTQFADQEAVPGARGAPRPNCERSRLVDTRGRLSAGGPLAAGPRPPRDRARRSEVVGGRRPAAPVATGPPAPAPGSGPAPPPGRRRAARPPRAWRSSRSRVAAVERRGRARASASRKLGSVRSRRETSSGVPSQPVARRLGGGRAGRASPAPGPARRRCRPSAAASCSASARNSESLSRKWWKIAPRDRPGRLLQPAHGRALVAVPGEAGPGAVEDLLAPRVELVAADPGHRARIAISGRTYGWTPRRPVPASGPDARLPADG